MTQLAKALIFVLLVLTVSFAIAVYLSRGDDHYYWKIGVLGASIYAAIGITVVVVSDFVIRWALRKRRERFANRSAKPS